MGSVGHDVITTISDALVRCFEAHVQVLEPVAEPSGAFDEARKQFSSVELLKALMQHTPPGDSKVVGVTSRDLFIPMLTFVFGQAQLDGRFALVSIERLRQEFYGLPPSAVVLSQRMVKETFHEIGHIFGLAHCSRPACPMSLSTTIRQVDAKSDEFCASCTAALERRGLRRKEQEYEVKLADSGR